MRILSTLHRVICSLEETARRLVAEGLLLPKDAKAICNARAMQRCFGRRSITWSIRDE
jgi:hypothetical protein